MKSALTVLLLAALGGCAASDQLNRPAATGAFVTTLGVDTLAVETFRRTPAGVEATVVLRSPATTVTDYRLDLTPDGAVRRFEAITRGPGRAGDPVRHEVAEPAGDSLRVTVREGGESTVRTVAGTGALPFIDMVHWPFELVAQRALASGQPAVEQPLFTDRSALTFRVGVEDDRRVLLTHPFRGTMTASVDAAGRLLSIDAAGTTRALRVTRVDAVDTDAIRRRFAAADAAGRPFGALSGRGAAEAQIGGARISIDYGQPARRGRDIFGSLVPWGAVWRTGANLATHFETDRDLVLGDLTMPAGRYTLFTIPEPSGGTLIISRQTGQGGTGYDAAQDLGRVPMSIASLPESVELFTIAVEPAGAGGVLRLRWHLTEFSVPFVVPR